MPDDCLPDRARRAPHGRCRRSRCGACSRVCACVRACTELDTCLSTTRTSLSGHAMRSAANRCGPYRCLSLRTTWLLQCSSQLFWSCLPLIVFLSLRSCHCGCSLCRCDHGMGPGAAQAAHGGEGCARRARHSTALLRWGAATHERGWVSHLRLGRQCRQAAVFVSCTSASPLERLSACAPLHLCFHG
jgi:hypothetical protein